MTEVEALQAQLDEARERKYKAYTALWATQTYAYFLQNAARAALEAGPEEAQAKIEVLVDLIGRDLRHPLKPVEATHDHRKDGAEGGNPQREATRDESDEGLRVRSHPEVRLRDGGVSGGAQGDSAPVRFREVRVVGEGGPGVAGSGDDPSPATGVLHGERGAPEDRVLGDDSGVALPRTNGSPVEDYARSLDRSHRERCVSAFYLCAAVFEEMKR